ncbi:sensor histidine kinase N-terminal domain-containing protein [Halomonas sp. TRM85114]|uniref:sensor histidine kinase n=1 Tax=Halomonas jincaotanensis TaxID=2810616 RepID=UPI001BD46D77|nr:sensor histidine kinase [Halomonas jincaotanensis]MBS9404204.1 sensor histidine kinase N-terminal domain-containing protein [Halomonas jincaotanensis]
MTLPDSLYRRLLVWLLLPLLALGGLMLLLAWSEARRTADRAFDRLLEAATLAIAEQVQRQDNKLWLDLPPAALKMLATDAEERVFYSLVDQDGSLVTGNAELPGDPRGDTESDDIHLFNDIEWRGLPLRQGVRRSRLEDWRQREHFEVRVAHTREGRDALTRELLRGNLAYILAMAAVAITVLLLAIRAALAPLTRLRRAIRTRDPRTLEPLTLPLPRELAELRETLNDLLARMRRVHANQERFIGDASHQLRTPLAGLSARAELALRQEDPARWREALFAMQTTSARTARLAMQLLSLTRLNNPEYHPDLAPLDLNVIARQAVRDHWSQCQRSDIDLGLEEPPDPDPLIISGVDWQLTEALNNLIDNARRYGARCITVRTRATPPTLEVEDDGPGIPAELRRGMLRPFHRGNEALEGSGLGLAIVEGIARSHHATLTLDTDQDGRGLCVRLVFPEEAQ